MKTLILVRHAQALSCIAAGVPSDELRPLSGEGRQKAAATALRLQALSLHPARILTSPLLRARQTAEILSRTFTCPVDTAEELDGFHPDKDVRDFLCNQLENTDVLLAVGHNPNISCVNHLLCGQMHAFRPGSFAVLNMENGKVPQFIVFGE